MADLLEIITLFFIASVKFIVAVGFLIAREKFGYLETILILFSGGTFGTIVFYYFGSFINKWINKVFTSKKKKQVFSKKNRFIVNVKAKYGLIGLTLLGPPVLSIPVGCFLASRFYSHDKKTLPTLILGVLFWSLSLPLIKLYIIPLFN